MISLSTLDEIERKALRAATYKAAGGAAAFFVILYVLFGLSRIGDALTLLTFVSLGGLLFLFMDFVGMSEKHMYLRNKYGDKYTKSLLVKTENEGRKLSISLFFEVERGLQNEDLDD